MRLLERDPSMRRYRVAHRDIYFSLEREGEVVKKLSYFGDLEDHEIVFLEALSILLSQKPVHFSLQLSLREVDFYLRDKNSQPSMSVFEDSLSFKNLMGFIASWPKQENDKIYHFPSQLGPFRALSLIDKVKEFQSFLLSRDVAEIYPEGAPRLLDIEGETIYLEVQDLSSEEKNKFESLHFLAVSAFQDEELNLIPEEKL